VVLIFLVLLLWWTEANAVGPTCAQAPNFVCATSTQTANTVLAGPTSGGAVAPTFRTLVDNDVPDILTLNLSSSTFSGTLPLANLTDDNTTSGNCLLSGGAGGNPAWGSCTAGGTGDITDVGNCTTGACFTSATANTVLAGPTSGGGAAATMRALVANDIPSYSPVAGGTANGSRLVLQGTTATSTQDSSTGQWLGSGIQMGATGKAQTTYLAEGPVTATGIWGPLMFAGPGDTWSAATNATCTNIGGEDASWCLQQDFPHDCCTGAGTGSCGYCSGSGAGVPVPCGDGAGGAGGQCTAAINYMSEWWHEIDYPVDPNGVESFTTQVWAPVVTASGGGTRLLGHQSFADVVLAYYLKNNSTNIGSFNPGGLFFGAQFKRAPGATTTGLFNDVVGLNTTLAVESGWSGQNYKGVNVTNPFLNRICKTGARAGLTCTLDDTSSPNGCGAGASCPSCCDTAGALNNAIGVDVADLTNAAALSAAFNTNMSAAATRYALRSTGTAVSVHAGSLRLGDTTQPTRRLEVTGPYSMTSGVMSVDFSSGNSTQAQSLMLLGTNSGISLGSGGRVLGINYSPAITMLATPSTIGTGPGLFYAPYISNFSGTPVTMNGTYGYESQPTFGSNNAAMTMQDFFGTTPSAAATLWNPKFEQAGGTAQSTAQTVAGFYSIGSMNPGWTVAAWSPIKIDPPGGITFKTCNAGTRAGLACTTDDTNATTGCPSATCPSCCLGPFPARYCDSGTRAGLPCTTDNTTATTGCPSATACPNCCDYNVTTLRAVHLGNMANAGTNISIQSDGGEMRHAGSAIFGSSSTTPGARVDVDQVAGASGAVVAGYANAAFPTTTNETRGVYRFADTYTAQPNTNGTQSIYNVIDIQPTATLQGVQGFDSAQLIGFNFAPTVAQGQATVTYAVRGAGTFTTNQNSGFGTWQLFTGQSLLRSQTANIPPYPPIVYNSGVTAQYDVASGTATLANFREFNASGTVENKTAGGTLNVTDLDQYTAQTTARQTAGTLNIATRRGIRVMDINHAAGTPITFANIGVDIEALTRATGNTNCTGSGTPVACCSGSGAGTCAGNIGLRNASPTVFKPSTVQTLTASSTILCNATAVQIQSTGNVGPLTSAPQIADGQDGQVCVITNVDTADTITLEGSFSTGGIRLNPSGATTDLALAPGDSITLQYSTTIGDWILISKSAVTSASPIRSASWFFPGNPISGVQVNRVLIPEGVTGCTITNSRITANTVGGTNTTFNIQRCTTAAGDCTATSNIYTSDVTLASSAQSAAGGAPNTTTISAGDAFRVNFTAVASALANVTVTMSYTCS